MPVENWQQTTIDGKNWLLIDAKLRVPLDWDPSSNVFVAIAAPTGGVLNYPVLVQGDPGTTPGLDTTINFTAIDWDSATPEFASFTEIAPDVYRLNLGLRNGEPGEDGDTVIDPDDYGTPVSKNILIVNPTADGFIYQSQLVGDSAWPTAINNTPSGNPAYTLCAVGITPQPFDWRPEVTGQCQIIGTGTDVAVDLLARLDNETAGNIVGRAIGSVELNSTSHVHPTHVLVDGPPFNSPDGYNKVLAGASATIWLRAERRTGVETFTTSNTTTTFKVKIAPVP